MSKKTITVKSYRQWKLTDEQIENADVVDGFAIHPDSIEGWTITHVKSGLACGDPLETKREAVEMRKLLRKLILDGVRLADMDAQAAIQSFPAFYEQLAQLLNKPVDQERKAWAIGMLEKTAQMLAGANHMTDITTLPVGAERLGNRSSTVQNPGKGRSKKNSLPDPVYSSGGQR